MVRKAIRVSEGLLRRVWLLQKHLHLGVRAGKDAAAVLPEGLAPIRSYEGGVML